MIFCEKNLMKIKISLHQNVEKSTSRKRYLYLFVYIGVSISVIKLPRIPTYLLKFNMQNQTKKRARFAGSKPLKRIKFSIFVYISMVTQHTIRRNCIGIDITNYMQQFFGTRAVFTRNYDKLAYT